MEITQNLLHLHLLWVLTCLRDTLLKLKLLYVELRNFSIWSCRRIAFGYGDDQADGFYAGWRVRFS